MISVDEDNLNIGLFSNLLPVLPYELAKFEMGMLVKFIQNHYLHLVTHFNDSGLEWTSQVFCDFQCAFCGGEEFKEATKLTENDALSMDLKQLWMPTINCLHDSTASQRVSFSIPQYSYSWVRFSIIGWRKSDDWHDLTDFSQEGILYAKQYDDLKKLAKDLN